MNHTKDADTFNNIFHKINPNFLQIFLILKSRIK
jgi:hypothetical protein